MKILYAHFTYLHIRLEKHVIEEIIFDLKHVKSYFIFTSESGMVVTCNSLIMSNQNIKEIGDLEELKRSCFNVTELDLAKNYISSWDEVILIFMGL